MQTHFHKPGPPLDEFVEVIWWYDGYHTASNKERLLPTGTTELVINLGENEVRIYDLEATDRYERFGGTVVCGVHSQPFVIDNDEQQSVLGVHFKPGGAFPFMRLPAGELHNTHVDLDTLWGGLAIDLRDEVLEAPTAQAKFRVVERRLMAAARGLDRHPAVRFALERFRAAPGMGAIGDVSSQIGLSSKRFIDVFRGEVGLTPKLFCRVLRFQQVLRRIGDRKRVEWADLAIDCGYFDQAHFIRDFQSFTGLNPSTYLPLRGDHLNHVPIVRPE